MRDDWTDMYHGNAETHDTSGVRIARRGTRILVMAPYSEELRHGMKALCGARWKPAIKAWSVPGAERKPLRLLLCQTFGNQVVPTWMWEEV